MKKFLPAAFVACLFLLIVGAKWATFDRFGSAMPDWDQWDAEAGNLYIPWFEHDHFLAHLFEPHNEHRVVLTKLQNLTLVLLNGQWDSRLEAVTNAMLHAALAVALWLCARRWVAVRWHAALFLLTAALFGLPLAWQNILGGFHSQQYWLLGLSFTAIVTVPFAAAWSAVWWLGALSSILVLGSMGSGFLAAVVVLALAAWRIRRGEETLRSAAPTLLLMVALIAVGALTRVEVYYHQELKARTAHDFLLSILRSMAWPLRDHDWTGFILWLPWLLLTWRVLRVRHDPTPPELRTHSTRRFAGEIPAQAIAALGGWTLVQIVATAYARGKGADYPASRYMDTLAFGAMVNGIALAWILSSTAATRPARLVRGTLALAWLAVLAFGLRDVTVRNLRYELPDAKKYYVKAEEHMRRYLATNDPKELAFPDIPYPSADGLIDRLSHPSLRALMAPPIRPALTLTPSPEPTTFLENDARRAADPQHPPQRGLSPATPALDALVSWGSFGEDRGTATTGIWKSAPLTPGRLGWLKFETAGNVAPNAPVSLTLRDERSDAVLASVRPTRLPGDTWRAAYVPVPNQPFIIVAHDVSTAQWIAFSAPVEMGSLSHAAWQAVKNGKLIVTLAAFATLALAIAAWWPDRARAADWR